MAKNDQRPPPPSIPPGCAVGRPASRPASRRRPYFSTAVPCPTLPQPAPSLITDASIQGDHQHGNIGGIDAADAAGLAKRHRTGGGELGPALGAESTGGKKVKIGGDFDFFDIRKPRDLTLFP